MKLKPVTQKKMKNIELQRAGPEYAKTCSYGEILPQK